MTNATQAWTVGALGLCGPLEESPPAGHVTDAHVAAIRANLASFDVYGDGWVRETITRLCGALDAARLDARNAVRERDHAHREVAARMRDMADGPGPVLVPPAIRAACPRCGLFLNADLIVPWEAEQTAKLLTFTARYTTPHVCADLIEQGSTYEQLWAQHARAAGWTPSATELDR